MQLVVSPHLEPDDIEVLLAAQDNPANALRAIAARNLADIEDALIKDRLNALAWLSASGLLEIKLALRLDSTGGLARGIFHEKTGSSLAAAVRKFATMKFDPDVIRQRAERFSQAVFRREMGRFVKEQWEQFHDIATVPPNADPAVCLSTEMS